MPGRPGFTISVCRWYGSLFGIGFLSRDLSFSSSRLRLLPFVLRVLRLHASHGSVKFDDHFRG